MSPSCYTDCLAPGCGAYGYDINQLCAAWTEAPEEMTKEQYQVTRATGRRSSNSIALSIIAQEWKLIQQFEMSLKKNTSLPYL